MSVMRSLLCLCVYKYVDRTVWLPCWLSRGQPISHQRSKQSFLCRWRGMVGRDPPCFETQGRGYQKSKTGGISGPTKRTHVLRIFVLKKVSFMSYSFVLIRIDKVPIKKKLNEWNLIDIFQEFGLRLMFYFQRGNSRLTLNFLLPIQI